MLTWSRNKINAYVSVFVLGWFVFVIAVPWVWFDVKFSWSRLIFGLLFAVALFFIMQYDILYRTDRSQERLENEKRIKRQRQLNKANPP